MTSRKMDTYTTIICILSLAAALWVISARDASAQANPVITCHWSVNYGSVPITATEKCSNGFERYYSWSSFLGRWVPVQAGDSRIPYRPMPI